MPTGEEFAQKTRLTMTRCSVTDEGQTTVESDEFQTMINPAEFKLDRSIAYSKEKTLGQLGTDVKFSAIEPEKVNFSIVLDGTGAVPADRPGAAPKAVKAHMAELLRVVYKYDGNRHEPSRVRLLWGGFIFYGRLESMSTQYTLFKPNGEPLRAKVTLAFVRYLSKNEEVLASNRSSPDLSHRVDVRMGDTLPLLCNRIYGDPRYYIEVARFNQLTDFRRLVPGSQLHFPPLA
jgi:hypothetical protein